MTKTRNISCIFVIIITATIIIIIIITTFSKFSFTF